MDEQTINLMLALLRCSLNGTQPDFLPISEKEWTQVFWLCRKHGVVTMINDVIDELPDELKPQGDIALSWSLSAERTRYHYARQEQVLAKIQQMATEAGLQLVLIKGMTLSKLYPHPSSRACGDIDVYFPGNYRKGNQLLGAPEAELDGKHAEMAVDGVTVENHIRFLDQGYISQRRAEKFITDSLGQVSTEGELPPMANMVYLLMHTVSHLTAKIKLPLRNFIDWGIFLRANQDRLDPIECHKVMNKIGMDYAFNIFTLLAGEFIGTDLSRYVNDKVIPADVERMRLMILNKDYQAPLDRTLPLLKRLAARLKRNRQRRWLYRYLPSNAAERLAFNLIRIFYKGTIVH